MDDSESIERILNLSKWFFDQNWKQKDALDNKANGLIRTLFLMLTANIAILSIVYKYQFDYFSYSAKVLSISFVLVGVGVVLLIMALFIRGYHMFDPGSLIKKMSGIGGEYEKIPAGFIISMESKELQKRYAIDLINKTYNNQRINENKAKFIKIAQGVAIANIVYILIFVILAYLHLYFSIPLPCS